VFLAAYANTPPADTTGALSRTIMESRLYGTNDSPPYSVYNYYQEVSGVQLLPGGVGQPAVRERHRARLDCGFRGRHGVRGRHRVQRPLLHRPDRSAHHGAARGAPWTSASSTTTAPMAPPTR
jgi:hypothetical protein